MRSSSRTLYNCLAAALLALLLTDCSAGSRQDKAGQAPRRGGSFKLIYQSSPETLDPQRIVILQDWEVASLVYEGLVGNGDQAAEIRPVLAERWEELDAGRRWVFHLRDNATFHDDACFRDGRGRRLVAADVVYTIERLAHAKTDCANWYLLAGKIEGIDDFRAGKSSSIRGLRALDENRVEFRLARPYASFLKILATQSVMIVPHEAVEHYGSEFGNHPVGTGPFRLVRRKPLEQYLFARNPRYWRKDARGEALPYLDHVDVSIRSDADERMLLASLLKGDTYLFVAQERLLETLRSDPSGAGKFRVVARMPETSLRFLGFSLDTPSVIARQPEVRRAVAMAYDRAELVRVSPQVRPILADTLVPAPFLARKRPWHPYDPKEAQAIFARHRKELDAAVPVIAVNFQSEDVNVLRRNLAALSVKAAVQVRPAKYYDYIVRERPSIFRVSFTPSFLDPEDYYCLFYSKSSREVNLTGYRSEEFDRTLETAMAELNPVKRAELFLELEAILYRDVPAVYLNHGTPTHLLSAPQVHGVALRFVLPDLSGTWLAEENNADRKEQPSK